MTPGNGQQPLMAWPGTQQTQNLGPIPGHPLGPPPAQPPFTGGTVVSESQGMSPEQQIAAATAKKAAEKEKKAFEKEARRNWATPPDRFMPWLAEFGFTLDLAANDQNHKLPRWIGPGSPLGIYDALTPNLMLPGESIYCNAPGFDWEYVKLAWRLMGLPIGQRSNLMVQLRPANQTDQPIWAELVEQYRDWNGHVLLASVGIDFRVRFLSPRVEHIPPPGIKASTPTSGHCLLIWRNLWAQPQQVAP